MPLKLTKRRGSTIGYIRGTVPGERVFESTGTCNRKATDVVRIRRESELRECSVYGVKEKPPFAAVVT
jgi:hypothetical protein